MNRLQKTKALLMNLTHTIATAAAVQPLPAILRPPPFSVAKFTTAVTMNSKNGEGSNDTNLDAIFKQKKILRSKVRKSLKEMDPILRSREDDVIQSLVLEAPWFKSSKRLCAYICCSALREVDTSRILSECLQNQANDGSAQTRKRLYVPRVEDKNSHMRMLNISRIDDLIANSMNILEPASVDSNGSERENVMQANEPVDLFILPGLAFDRSGRRLGRGGGYYDTLLKNYQNLAKERNWKQPLLVAISYSVQILEGGVIPLTPNDVFVDALVSPDGVIPISPTASERLN